MNEPAHQKDAFATLSNALFLTIRTVCICATILLLAYLFVPHPHEARRLWTPDLIQTQRGENGFGRVAAVRIPWTPSAKTKDYLHMENG